MAAKKGRKSDKKVKVKDLKSKKISGNKASQVKGGALINPTTIESIGLTSAKFAPNPVYKKGTIDSLSW